MIQILIVDDEPLVVISIRTMIEKSGLYVTGECSNGKEALDYITVHPQTDIVITDVDMPVMDGLELAEQLNVKGFHQSLLFLSAYSNFTYVRKAFQSGAVDYILKTELEQNKLDAVLGKIIQERRKAGLNMVDSVSNNIKENRSQFFRYLLDKKDQADTSDFQNLFDRCGFSVGFPLYFMILRPGDIPEVLRRYGTTLSDFTKNTCGLLRQFVVPRGGDVTGIEYDQYCIFLKDAESLEDVYFRFYDSAWIYLDTGFEKRISPDIKSFNSFVVQYRYIADKFLSFSRAVVRARRYICEHYTDKNLDLMEISNYAELSRNHLSSIFSSETGETVVEFLSKTRIQAAKKLLRETNLRTFEIADKTGFSNVETFCRLFKKVTGINPGKIRQ
jgi:two-component system, response regulator YesN